MAWHGRAILLPAPSRSGKSRLVDALVRAGAIYYSDEFAPIDRTGHVHAFPQALQLRHDNGTVCRVAATALGTGDRPPLPIGAIVSTRFVQDASWMPELGSAADAVRRMSRNLSKGNQDWQ